MVEALGGFDPRSAYNAAARDYEDASRDFWQFLSVRTLDRLALRPGERVLDVPCGTGPSVVDAAHRVGPSGLVVGIDFAEQMLEIARHKIELEQLANAVVMGSGLRRTVAAIGPEAAAAVRARCDTHVEQQGVQEVLVRSRYAVIVRD